MNIVYLQIIYLPNQCKKQRFISLFNKDFGSSKKRDQQREHKRKQKLPKKKRITSIDYYILLPHLQQKIFMDSYQKPSEISEATSRYRQQIRRKDIQKKLAERRKQLIQFQKHYINTYSPSKNQKLNKTASIETILERIKCCFIANNRQLSPEELKQLATISCTLAGAEIFASNSNDFLILVLEQYLMGEKYSDTTELNLVLLILNNSLTVSNNNERVEQKNYVFTQLITNEKLIHRVFSISVDTTKKQIKQNAISVIFCIIYNNQPSFIRTLVTNPDYYIINILVCQLNTESNICASVGILVDVLRCFYLIVKKLSYNCYEQFSKMRKYILFTIKNSPSFQLTMIGALCLHSLLKSVPSERSIVSKSGILGTILNQSITFKNSKLAVWAIKIASYLIEGDNNPKMLKEIILFIQMTEQILTQVQFQQYAYKTLYDILINYQYPVDELLTNFQPLIERMRGLFESNQTNRQILIQLSFLFIVICTKSRVTKRDEIEIVRARVEEIASRVQMEQKDYKFLQQSLTMLPSNQANNF